MGTTLTIRNLENSVKQLLRIRAANHGRSMEAEARDILSTAVKQPVIAQIRPALPTLPTLPAGTPPSKSPCDSVRGIWKGRISTDEAMLLTRGDR